MTRSNTPGSGSRPPAVLGDAPWLTAPATQAVFTALTKGGHEARAVGGAVRNALMSLPVKDIDIATTAVPEEVVRLATDAGLKAIPTGIEHGTVTVLSEHTPFEVTTLRRDVETFGRHARVTYSTDWAEDAARRDFTINALYCSADGVIHDPLGGLADIAARRVRFIGDAHARIREDYLRILRFFRFTASYAPGLCDAAGLAASVELAAGLDGLSRERVRAELLRLIAAPFAGPVLGVMHETGLIARILPVPLDLGSLMRLIEIEQALERAPDPVLRLATLVQQEPGTALTLRDALRLSSGEYERLAKLAMPDRAFDPASSEHEAKVYIYRHGAEAFTEGALLAWARSADGPDNGGRGTRLRVAQNWQAPVNPVRGSDIVALGVAPGPNVGRIMSQFEDWWIEAGFPGDAHRIAHELQRLTLVTKA